MTDLRKGVATVLPMVAKKTRHRDYGRTVDLRDTYYQPMTTGVGVEHLIHRFNRREDEEQHRQRIRLTEVVTPALINRIMGPVRKIPRVKPNVNRADFGVDKKALTDEVMKAASKFYAGKNVDHFLGSVGLDAGAIDPNAFCIIAFDTFDGRYETPRPYPTVIGCQDVWNFEYANGELQWLLVHRNITYIEIEEQKKTDGQAATEPVPVTKSGNWFCAYFDNDQVMFTQVDTKTVKCDPGFIVDANGEIVSTLAIGKSKFKPKSGPGKYYFRVSEVELYEVEFFAHNSGMVPAFRMGYKIDWTTAGRTCVSMWHTGLPYLLKGIKAGSELDLSSALHVFLKEYSYGPRCPGHKEGNRTTECIRGCDPNGEKCKRCNGSGMFRIDSGQDHVTIPLPQGREDLLELAKLHHYAELPVEVLTWQDGYFDRLGKKSYEAVYNSEPLDRAEVQPTATAEIKDNENVYDTLQPGCDWYAENRVRIYTLIARYTVGNEKSADFVCQYEFPRNLRFESIADLVALHKALKDAGTSAGTRLQVGRDIREAVFVDDETALKRANTMESFDPFAGKDDGTIVAMISQDKCSQQDAILWFNMNRVFSECEAESATKGVDFYDMARPEQQKMIDGVVESIIEEMTGAEGDEAMMRLPTGSDGPGGANADGTLNGAQATALSEIVIQASTGVLSKETAKAMIEASFPTIPPAKVDEIVAGIKEVTPEQVRASDRVADSRDDAGSTTKPTPAASANGAE